MSDLPPESLSPVDPSGLGIGPISVPEKPVPRVKDPAEVQALEPGSYFIDPAGTRRQRPYEVAKVEDVPRMVPEGSHFRLGGRVLERPKTEPLDLAAEMLVGMAGEPAIKKRALEVYYGRGNVQEEPGSGELLVKGPDGKILRAGKGVKGVAGWLGGAAAPSALGIGLGTMGAGAGATLSGGNPLAAFGAGVAGGATGMALGQSFNDLILGLFGVTSSDEEKRRMMQEAVTAGALGEGAGRVLGKVVPPLYNIGKEVVQGTTKLSEAGPRALRYISGTDPVALKRALALREGNPAEDIPGVVPPASSFAHEIPMLKLISEEFDPKFRLSPMMQSRERFYEATAKKLGEPFEAEHPGGSFLSPERAVDMEQTGTMLQQRVADDLASKNAALDRALEARTAELQTTAVGAQAEKESAISALETASADLRKTATAAVDAAFTQLDKHVEDASLRMGGGPYPGAEWGAHQNVMDRLHTVKGDALNSTQLGITGVASRGYGASYALAGQTPLYKVPLEREAADYLARQAPGFENEAPGIVQKFESISKPVGTGQLDAEGKEIMAVPDFTLEQAHSLLKWANAKPNWNAFNSDAVEGAKKHMAGMLQRWLHDPRQPAAVQAGVRELDHWNRWYGNAMKKFEQKAIVEISREMDQGRMLNAPTLAKMIFEERNPSDYNLLQVKKLLGGQRFRDLLTLDMGRVIDEFKDSTGKVDGLRLANDAADRIRRGVWPETDIGKDVVKSAQRLSLLQGKLSVEALPGDTVGSLLTRAEQLEKEITVRAKQDPLGVLDHAMKEAAKETAAGKVAAYQEVSGGPLGFLARGLPGEQSLAAGEAAKRIIENPSLIGAAAERFGVDSPAFQAIRRNYVESIFQHGNIENVLRLPSAVQDALLPGLTKDDMITFARNWEFLKGSGGGTFGGGLAATSRVTNPVAELRKLGGHRVAALFDKAPIIGPYAARYLLGKYYAAVTDKIVTNVNLWRYMAKGLDSGDKMEAENARRLFTTMMQPTLERLFGEIGVGIEALQLEQPSTKPAPGRQRAPVVRPNMPGSAPGSAAGALESIR